MRYRSLLFTDYNYTELEGDEYLEFWKQLGYKFIVFQLERCPSSGRLHWQGFVQLSKQRTRSKLQSIFRGLHCEKRRGTIAEAINYCEKEETRERGPFRDGDIPSQGKRTDLDDVKQLLDSGATELEIAENHFGAYCRYYKAFGRYGGLRARPRNEKTHSIVYWGKPGTGKTRTVYDTFGSGAVYDMPRPNGGSFWFDGLIPGKHRVLLLDDFYGWLPLHLLLKLMDRYPLQVPIKGGMIEFNCEKLYITSNKHYDEWYDWSKLGHNLKQAFIRRIDEILEFE